MGLHKFFAAIFLTAVFFISITANAALVSRQGGLAYYDDVAGLTWLTDANAGTGSAFDDGSSTSDGQMTWANANTWAASLNIDGVTGWRLPITVQPDPSCSDQFDPGGGADLVDHGFCTGSEMGNLFYNVLGGSAGSSITTTHNVNYDLFSNVQSFNYWSATEYIPGTNSGAWQFNFNNGTQLFHGSASNYYAWAVHDGDIGAVPLPAAVWLFGSGLLGLIGIAKRKKA